MKDINRYSNIVNGNNNRFKGNGNPNPYANCINKPTNAIPYPTTSSI